MRLSPEKLRDRWAPVLVSLLSLAILILVQTSFFFRKPAVNVELGYYVLLTFGALAFVAAGLYLPQVLKLKVAGVELEKSSVEKVVAPPLGIRRDPFAVRTSSVFPSAFSAAKQRRITWEADAAAGTLGERRPQPEQGAKNLRPSSEM
jgi:hypothetical protein